MFAAFPACAQDGDDYVYVTDVITNTDLGSTSGVMTRDVEQNAKYLFVANNAKSSSRFYFTNANKCALVTKQSCGHLISVKVEGESNFQKYPLRFFVKNSAYKNNKDLFDAIEENYGTELSDFTYSGSSNQNLQITIPAEYRYIAIKNNTDGRADPYLKSISITWQLEHIRPGLTVGSLGTLCLPYGIKAEDMDGITAYSIAGKTVENDVVTSVIFNEVDHIEAGKPYLFVANSNEIALKYHGTKAENPLSENGMYGVYERHPFAEDSYYDNNYYVIANNIVQAASNKSGVNANCAYIRMDEVPLYNPAQNSQRALIITGEGFTQTDIAPTLLNSPTSSTLSNSAVDLSGRRVANGTIPTISIINGKKTLVR